MKTFFVLACLSICCAAQAKYITLTVAQISGASVPDATNELLIAEGEIAEVKWYPYDANFETHLVLQKDGKSFWFNPGREGMIFTGPAKVLLRARAGGYGIATIKLDPETFPPDKTLVVPAGSGARVALEYSTNLTHWAELHSVTHTNPPANLFFRIKAERLNPPR